MNQVRSHKILRAAVAVTTLVSLGMVAWYVHESRKVSFNQNLTAAHAQNSVAMAQLSQEVAAYAQKDPGIIPVLNRLAGRTNAAAAAPVPAPSPNRR